MPPLLPWSELSSALEREPRPDVPPLVLARWCQQLYAVEREHRVFWPLDGVRRLLFVRYLVERGRIGRLDWPLSEDGV